MKQLPHFFWAKLVGLGPGIMVHENNLKAALGFGVERGGLRRLSCPADLSLALLPVPLGAGTRELFSVRWEPRARQPPARLGRPVPRVRAGGGAGCGCEAI